MTYPQDISDSSNEYAGARIAQVKPDSPAAMAGLMAGMHVLCVDGEPLGDILDWYWYADELEIELEVLRHGGETEDTVFISLQREPGESWGIEFSSVLFDGLQSCANNCIFCFMRMLPEGMRPALYVRDDDYRLSFLHGNFVTLTNLDDDDVDRIIEMHLSPLNVSLHAISPDIRLKMMGKNHARGVEVLEQLLEAGIEFKAQIVLMPGINDGAELDKTLAWIAAQPGILATGIVPYGYTRYATVQHGFDTKESAREVIKQIQHLAPRVQLADEFFVKAWPSEVLDHLPAADYYGDFPLIEDGIGMLRAFIDDARGASESILVEGNSLLATGESFAAVLRELLPEQLEQIVAVKNEFFGGNVDVAGLLTAEDVVDQVRQHSQSIGQLLLPSTMFNDNGLTLDGKTAAYIKDQLACEVKISS